LLPPIGNDNQILLLPPIGNDNQILESDQVFPLSEGASGDSKMQIGVIGFCNPDLVTYIVVVGQVKDSGTEKYVLITRRSVESSIGARGPLLSH